MHWELIRIARRSLGYEQNNLPLQTVELVNETDSSWLIYQMLMARSRPFYCICARLTRQILIDYARHRVAEKRGGGAVQVHWLAALSPGVASDRYLGVDEPCADWRRSMNEMLDRRVMLLLRVECGDSSPCWAFPLSLFSQIGVWRRRGCTES